MMMMYFCDVDSNNRNKSGTNEIAANASAQIQPGTSGEESKKQDVKKEGQLWRILFGIYKNFSINGEWRKSLYYAILGLVIFIFSSPIESFLGSAGQKLFASWQPQGIYDVLFVLVLLILGSVHFIRLWIRYQARFSQQFGFIVGLILYSKFRFCSASLGFVGMFWCPGIFYADLLAFGIALGPIQQAWTAFRLRRSMTKVKNSASVESKSFEIDFNPIANEKEDALNRSGFVNLICKEVGNANQKTANSIGIIGGWGEGKSSILNFVKSRLLKEDKVIVMEFSPWLVLDKADYAQEFLQSLQLAVAPYSGLAKQSIQAFEEALLQDADKGIVSSIGVWAKNQLLPSWTRKSMHEGLVEAVSNMQKKIVVIIDDLDRLTSDELREAFRIIRNIGCIPGVQLISAFDRKHLLRLMDVTEYGDPASFLQKIFPVCCDLPAVPDDKIRDLIIRSFENQNESLAGAVPGIKAYIREKGWVLDREYIALPANMTIREANIFAHELTEVLNEIGEEVYVRDLILITLVKVKYPILFHLIREKLAGVKEEFLPNQGNAAPIKVVFPSMEDLYKEHGVDKVGFGFLEKLFRMTGDTKKPNVPDSMRIRNERGFKIYFCADNSAVKFSLVKEVLRSSREKLAEKFGNANPQADLWVWQQMLDFLLPGQDEDEDYVLNYFWVSICCDKVVLGNSNIKVIDYASQAKRFNGTLIKRLPSFVGIPDSYRNNAIRQLGYHNEMLIKRIFDEYFGSSRDLLKILHELLEDYANKPASSFTSVVGAFEMCVQSFDSSEPDKDKRIFTEESLGIMRKYIKENLEKYLDGFLNFRTFHRGKEVIHFYLHFDIFSDVGEQKDFLKLVAQHEKKHRVKTNLKRLLTDSDRGKAKMVFESPQTMRDFFKGTIYEEQMEREIFNK